MKIWNHLSLISIVIALCFLILKLTFDFKAYNTITTHLQEGDMQPTLIAGRIKIILLFLIPLFISLIISFIGIKRRNKCRKLAVVINIVTIIYLLIPLGLLLSTI